MSGSGPPAPGGRGPKKRRKRGGAAGGAGPSGSGPPPTGRGGGGRGGNRSRRGAGRGGGGSEASRFRPGAPSPLSVPHTKVTIRHVGGNDCTSIEAIVESVKQFVEGAFPSAASGDDDPYVIAWRSEREEFDKAKNMFAEATGDGVATGGGGTASASSSVSSSSASRIFSSGWVYEEKPRALPCGRFDRLAMIPEAKTIATDLMDNKTEKKVADTTNIHWVVDTAMSQMMTECGKRYLDFVGGRVVFDEESAADAALAERVQAERKKLEGEKKKQEENDAAAAEGDEPGEAVENGADEKKDEAVEAVTKGVAKLSTADKPPAKPSIPNDAPAIRVRILSVTPVKQSKRRGEIAGKVQLALYPPDPCLLFREACREAGTRAGEAQVERANEAADVAEKEAAGEKKEESPAGAKEETMEDSGTDDDAKADAPTDDNGEDAKGAKTGDQSDAKDEGGAKPAPKRVTMPPVPYYPLLSPAERSRAVARSRVLLNRTVEALRLHAAAQSKASHDRDAHHWEVLESTSQKTWKARPHEMVGQVLAGADLGELVAEQEKEKSNIAAAKKATRTADRLDSTIEKSEDYKAFMDTLKDGSDPSNAGKDAKKGAGKEEAVPVDEEGRPLSAIVQYFRAKQEVERKAKAEVAAAKARARAAATSAKQKAKKDASRKKKRGKRESGRSRKSRPAAGGGGGGTAMPPQGATLLKKGAGSSALPPSGFG